MPRYYFHVKDVIDYRDGVGVELPDLAAAREEAVSHFGEVLQAHAGEFTGEIEWQLMVTDHRGLTLLTFSFFMGESAAVQGLSQSSPSRLAMPSAAENHPSG